MQHSVSVEEFLFGSGPTGHMQPLVIRIPDLKPPKAPKEQKLTLKLTFDDRDVEPPAPEEQKLRLELLLELTFDERDVELVMTYGLVDHETAVRRLQDSHGDLVNAMLAEKI